MANNEDKKKALDAAIAKLEKDFGKGTVMKLGVLTSHIYRDILSLLQKHRDHLRFL